MCQFLGPAQVTANLTPIARMKDGTPVFGNSEIGGLAEFMVTPEEWVIPIKSTAPAAHLGMVCSCVSVAGLGATTSQGVVTVAPGSTVAVVGCGPLGLSAVQGAHIAGATTIVAIDPVRVRREAAAKLGATHVLDPNREGEGLVEKVRAITLRDNPIAWAGGRTTEVLGGAGADLVVEAAGCEWVTPRVERGPDPNGVLPMRQAYDMTCPGGALVTTGLVRGNIEFPAVMFAIGGRTHHAGQAGGCSPLRDIPRFVSLMESGRFDAEAMIGAVVPLEKMLEAYEDVAYRTSLFSIMTL
jgi:S-(hydroxymethyl)glutathione dehydrogenase/alcohol dehydrogenase